MVYRTYKNGYDRGVVYGVLLYTYIIRSISITNAKDLYGFIWFLIVFLTHLKFPTQIVQSPCWQVDSRQKFCFPRSKKWFSSVVTNPIWVHQLLKSQVLRACQLLIGGLWPSPARQQRRILLRTSRNPNAPDLIGTLLLLWQGTLLLITAYHGPNNLFFPLTISLDIATVSLTHLHMKLNQPMLNLFRDFVIISKKAWTRQSETVFCLQSGPSKYPQQYGYSTILPYNLRTFTIFYCLLGGCSTISLKPRWQIRACSSGAIKPSQTYPSNMIQRGRVSK